MFNTQLLFPQALPWLFLFISIISAFIKPKFAWCGLVITLLSAFLLGAISVTGIALVGVLLAISYGANKSEHRIIKVLLTTLVIIFCLALAAHLLPGFNNLLVLEQVSKSEQSRDFTMYLNIDKPMILFALLLMYPDILKPVFKPELKSELKPELNLIWPQLLGIIAIALIVIFGLANAWSLIKIEPSLPSWWWLFVLNNLLLTCVMEELFFRGFIQQQLSKHFKPIIGLAIASILFGIAHFGGGLAYVFIATLAGILYGFIYQATGKLSYAIAGHFLLNFLHLWLFTYPLAK